MATSFLLRFLPAALLLLLSSSTTLAAFIPKISTFPANPPNQTVSVTYTSSPNSLDAPNLSGLNSSVYEWWYFDAVSADLSTAMVLTFFATSPNAFPLIGPVPSDVSVYVWLTFPNGTTASFVAPAETALVASGGFLGNAAAGTWQGTNATFAGTPGLEAYEISFDFTETYGIKGEMVLDSRAPAHLPCTADLGAADSSLSILPNLGWTNAVPDAAVTGSFTLTGGPHHPATTYPLTDASGYHDKNWGSVPFFESVNSWWWGRGRLGPYSLVWFQGTDTAGKAFANAYVSLNGTVLAASCSADSTVVTAKTAAKGALRDIQVKMLLDGGKVMQIQVAAETIVADAPGVYERWLGSVSGGVVGGEKYAGGLSVFERFYPQ